MEWCLPRAEAGQWGSVDNGYGVSVWDDEKVLEIDGGDSCTTARMYFMPLNRTLKNGQSGRSDVLYTSPKYKKKKIKETRKEFVFRADLPFSQERRILMRLLVA